MRSDQAERIAVRLFWLSIGVFFIGGFIASTVGLLVPRLRLFLGLNYVAATSIQLAFHSSYLLFALPVAAYIAARGYMRAHAAGLSLIAVGAVLLVIGLALPAYPLLFAALLTISAGSTFLQIASNTVVTVVSDPARVAVRLNLLQGFNAIGTVVGPVFCASLILGDGTIGAGIPTSAIPFGVTAVILAVLAWQFWRNRDLLHGAPQGETSASRDDWAAVLRNRRLLGGTAAIFAYVGAEVTIGSLLTDYLMLPDILGLDAIPAARLVALYWGGAMVGRFIGAALLNRVAPARLLGFAAVGAGMLTTLAALAGGPVAATALIAVGLFNSVMYPTIYVLALPTARGQATPGATILCMAVVGGAIIPPLTGLFADAFGLAPSLLLPAACYVAILIFARGAGRVSSNA